MDSEMGLLWGRFQNLFFGHRYYALMEKVAGRVLTIAPA
jgi:hypothetical protein